MAQYIIKSALAGEIESKFQKYWKIGEDSDALQDGNAKYWGGVLSCLIEVKTLIDTLEVKEVDLKKEIDKIWNPRFNLGWDEKSLLSINHEGFTTIAKYFYELGLKTKENKL